MILKMYDEITRKLPDQLDLMQEQMDKYNQMVKQHRQAVAAIVEKLEQERAQFDKELHGILTPEQQVKLKEMKERREAFRDRMHPGPKGPGAAGPCEGMGPDKDRPGKKTGMGQGKPMVQALEKMNLSVEKKEQVQKVLKESWDRMQACPKGDREARQAIHRETRDRIEKILSPEEMQQLRELIWENRGPRGDGPGKWGRDGRGPGGRDGAGRPKDEPAEDAPASAPPAVEESLW